MLWEHYDSGIIIALDICRPYLENRRESPAFVFPVVAGAQSLSTLFLPRSIDAVTMIDSIEHLVKDEALAVLDAIEQIARERVIIFTPRGFFPQTEDNYGMHGEQYQTHKSGWEPEEFLQRGYKVIVLKGFHNSSNAAFRASMGVHAPAIDALLAYKIIKDE